MSCTIMPGKVLHMGMVKLLGFLRIRLQSFG